MPEDETPTTARDGASVGGEVARVRTPITMDAAALELEAALRAAGVTELERGMCCLLLAQIALEIAGGSACDNHNPGNLTANDQGSRDFFRPQWFIVDPTSPQKLIDLHNEMEAGRAPRAFRSYPDFPSGFADHVKALVHTFPTIIDAARTGDAVNVAGAIRSSRYTPGINVPRVARSLDSLQRQFLAKGLFAALPLAGAPPAPPDLSRFSSSG